MTSVAVLDDYQRRAAQFADWGSLGDEIDVDFFAEPIPREQLAERLAGYEVLVLMRERTRFDAEVLSQLPELQLVITTGMRNASLDVDHLVGRGVVVCGTGGMSAPSSGGVPSTTEVAWSQNLTAERAAEVGAEAVSQEDLLVRSDVLSIHLVLSERSRGLFGAAELSQMRPTAVLINTSRGPIVDERALIDALRDGTIAAAGLDVYDTEPLPTGHVLTQLDNVVLLPHLGYVSEASMRNMYGQVVEAIVGWRDGAPIRTLPAASR